MTEELFRSDAYLRECAAVVTAVNEIEYNWIRLYFTRKVGVSLGIPAG